MGLRESTRIDESDIYISGTKDYLLKPFKSALLIEGGGHFMIVDNAQDVNTLINKYLN